MPRIPTSPRWPTPWSSTAVATTLSPRMLRGGRRGARAAASTIVLGLSATLTGWAPAPGSAPSGADMAPDVARVRLEGLAPPYFLPLGRTARLSVRAWTANGDVVGTAPRWRVDDAASATIDAASGVVAARRRGFVRVGASIGDTTAWWTLTVAPPADTVELQISRRAPGTGTVLVSSAVPLVAGALRPGDEARVHVIVDGAEPAVRVAPLAARHADGSLRAVLVQFRWTPSSGAAEAPRARLVVGAPRRAGGFAGVAPPSIPEAALLPIEPDYLIAADVVGPTLSARETGFLGSAFRRYDQDFATAAEARWKADGDAWEHNYYDRALVYFAQWTRTGRSEYWWRGVRQAVAYRRDYLEKNEYLASPHWAQLEGIEKHYVLTGDEASRTAVARTAEVIWSAVQNNGGIGPSNDPRIAGRMLLATLLAWRLGGANGVTAGWPQRLDQSIARVAAWQARDGLYPSGPTFCDGQYNFMAGLLNDALVKIHDYYRADPRIETAVRRSVDYQWRTQWVDARRAFKYSSVACKDGGPDPTGDLTGLIVAPFGWVYRQTGDPRYRMAGDRVFAGGVEQAYLVGDKQFNQAYTTSWRYLGYR